MDEPTYHNETRESVYENCAIADADSDVVTSQPSNSHHPHSQYNHLQHHHDTPDNGVARKTVVISSEREVARVDEGGPRHSHHVTTRTKYEITGPENRAQGPASTKTRTSIYSDGNPNNREWDSELFYSLNGKPQHRSFKENALTALKDCGNLPCTMCSVASRLGDPKYLPFVPCAGPAIRFKVRVLGGIKGTILNDCLVTTCCGPCAYCQMLREMDEIGL